MSGNENKLAIYQVIHTSVVALGATLLAVGITFFALAINTIMTSSGSFTNNEIQHLTNFFLNYYAIFVAIGGIIIFVSTILFIIAIKRLKKID